MPPKRPITNAVTKRKASTSSPPEPTKRPRTNTSQYKDSTVEEKYGIIQRRFYPPEMTNERAHAYNMNQIERPIETLKKALKETREGREAVTVKDAVVHWFKCDLRTRDNKALHMASQQAKTYGVPLIAVYFVSPQDFQAHLTSPVRVDFILRTLKVLRSDLAELNVPLYVETVEKRRNLPGRLIEFCVEWGVSHVFANMEYEVDELRREANLTRLCLEKEIAFHVVEDTCVVAPYELSTLSGGQFAVYSPWYRAWVRYLNEKPDHLKEYAQPEPNSVDARAKFERLFDCGIPSAPANKSLTDEERRRFSNMWPPGEGEAHERLQKFIKTKIQHYKESRNLPAGNATSVLSVHLASGTLAARMCVREARDANRTKKLDGGQPGNISWISEVAWRDFYKHVISHCPWTVMNKPYKVEYSNIEWEYNLDHFIAWTEGKTGFPLVDAAMRQMKYSGYMHNRCRMVVASFLAKDLLIDWRMGEKYFMETLIDRDFASNNCGWGFSASCGVDPQPYFRIFNPLLQSEKFDPSGDYIRKWVPELKDIQGKAIHDPYGRGAELQAKQAGYPRAIVDHKVARDRCLARYKAGIGRQTA